MVSSLAPLLLLQLLFASYIFATKILELLLRLVKLGALQFKHVLSVSKIHLRLGKLCRQITDVCE